MGNALDPFNLGWVVGILDGEGCFSLKKRSICITCGMTDRDTILRLQAVVGGGTLNEPLVRENRKPNYVWNLSVREDVVGLLAQIKPHMSKRRQARIEELIKWDKEHPKTRYNTGKPLRSQHGSHRMYQVYKCKCEVCVAHAREYRKRKKERNG